MESKAKYFKIDGFVIVCMISSFIHSFISLSFIRIKDALVDGRLN
jgi:hypothetical protein